MSANLEPATPASFHPFAELEASLLRDLFPHSTGSPEEFREAARRYVIDFATWLDAFLRGEPEKSQFDPSWIPRGCPMPAFRLGAANRNEVQALFVPILRHLRTVPVTENAVALATTVDAADKVLRAASTSRTEHERRSEAAKRAWARRRAAR